jgi:hypothetical protein
MAKTDFPGAFAALKPLFSRYADRLKVTIDSEGGYSVSAKSPSPFPQHKGEPLFFGAVRTGKAYVGFHLMPLYMCPALLDLISGGAECADGSVVPAVGQVPMALS